MSPFALVSAGLALGLLFPLAGSMLGATGPVLWLLSVVPVLLAGLGALLGAKAEAQAEAGKGEALRTARARRDEAERAAAELLLRSKGLATAAAALDESTTEASARVRSTSETLVHLSATATAAALTAETVVGLARVSERAAGRGLGIAEQSREALVRLAEEVQALSQLISGLGTPMGDLLEVTAALERLGERSRSLSSVVRGQADGGELAPEALPALLARMEGHVAETAAAAARARAILAGVQEAITRAVAAAEAGSLRAGEGAMVLEGAAGTIRELARALSTSAASGREIAGIAEQQAAGIEEVREAMNGIFLAGERTAGSTRDVAGQARALADLAARLRRAVRPDE